jgi:hypothetical protein
LRRKTRQRVADQLEQDFVRVRAQAPPKLERPWRNAVGAKIEPLKIARLASPMQPVKQTHVRHAGTLNALVREYTLSLEFGQGWSCCSGP